MRAVSVVQGEQVSPSQVPEKSVFWVRSNGTSFPKISFHMVISCWNSKHFSTMTLRLKVWSIACNSEEWSWDIFVSINCCMHFRFRFSPNRVLQLHCVRGQRYGGLKDDSPNICGRKTWWSSNVFLLQIWVSWELKLYDALYKQKLKHYM